MAKINFGIFSFYMNCVPFTVFLLKLFFCFFLQGAVGPAGRPGARGLAGKRVRFVCTKILVNFSFIQLRVDLFIDPRADKENQANVDKSANQDQR